MEIREDEDAVDPNYVGLMDIEESPNLVNIFLPQRHHKAGIGYEE